MNLICFADAGHTNELSQLLYFIGLDTSPVQKGSIFRLLSYSSHQSKMPSKSTSAAEIPAAGEGVEELTIIQKRSINSLKN